MPKIYAHIVGPNEYKLTALQIQLELLELYTIINTFRIPAAAQKKTIQAASVVKKGQNQLPVIVIGPLWSFEISCDLQFFDNVNQACFIVDRVDEDSMRISLMRDRIRRDVIEGVVNLDLTRGHLENVWNLFNAKYGQIYTPLSIIDMVPLLSGPCIKPIIVDNRGISKSRTHHQAIDKSVHFNKYLDITQIPARK